MHILTCMEDKIMNYMLKHSYCISSNDGFYLYK